jgi:hypothetical protein
VNECRFHQAAMPQLQNLFAYTKLFVPVASQVMRFVCPQNVMSRFSEALNQAA